jgi:hypothetical protein
MDDANLFSSFTNMSSWYNNYNTKGMGVESQPTTSQATDFGPVTSYTPYPPPMMKKDEEEHDWGDDDCSIERALPSALMAEESVGGLDAGYLALSQAPAVHSDSYVRAYGQITPPNDLSPSRDSLCSPDVVKREVDSSEQKPARPERSQKAPRRRKAVSKDDDGSGSTPAAPPAKKQRKRRNAAQVEGAPETEDGAKREMYLEKNRIAAIKCRQKKKMWESELVARARELSAARACLRPCVTALREEVIALKTELLKHVGCSCTAIHEYLTQSATQMLPLASFECVQGGTGLDRKPSASFHEGFIAATNTLDVG